MVYWFLLKSGQLAARQRQPKNKNYVTEEMTERKGEFQVYDHCFRLYDSTGQEKDTQTMVTYCGYDRGVAKPNKIKQMLEGLK